MSNPNEQTGWAAQDGPGEAVLDFKDPIAENDPNVGTRWGDPVDRSKPRPRVARDIDKFLDQPIWKCPDCGTETLTENGKLAHLTAGQDGMTPCLREKARFKPVKDCQTCGGTGRGAGQCPSCSGSGDGKFTAKCRGCNGKGVLRDSSKEPCNICGGSGQRTYCADCSGSGEINHCSVCKGSGKVPTEQSAPLPPSTAQAIDEDTLAQKIAEPIVKTMNEGFAMLAAVLSEKAPKVKKTKKAKVSRGSSAGVRGGAPAGGSKSVPALERADAPVADPPSEPEKAE